jgi:protein tyrosine phosphatase
MVKILMSITLLMSSTSACINVRIFPALPLEVRQKHKHEVKEAIEQRWGKVLQQKATFSPYQKKSDQEILEEFNELQNFRRKLWYKNPEGSPHICQEDYMAAQDLLEKGFYRHPTNIAFAYNRTDSSYNASTVLFGNYHFIAMQEPDKKILNLFFKFLINHQASILVRLKRESEFSNDNSIKYWKNRLQKNAQHVCLNIMPDEKNAEAVYIPYCYTDEWTDNEGMRVEELYRLVQEVQTIYRLSDKERPIACHCASGVGRTGTFIAAFVLAELLDRSRDVSSLSIEEIVLKLSIQRPNLVGTKEQYLLIYRFADYYFDQMNKAH